MKVSIETPEQYMGDIIGNMNSRRGKVINMEMRDDIRVIDCHAPLSDMFGYSTQLRSLSQGRADESMVSMQSVYSNWEGGARGYVREGGASFDTQTGSRLALSDICTDMRELVSIIADSMYAEEGARIHLSQTELEQYLSSHEASPDNMDSWYCSSEGLHIYVSSDAVASDDAGNPHVLIRYEDNPQIFNETYILR